MNSPGLLGGFPAASDNVDTEVFKSNGGTTRAAVTVLSAIYFALLFALFGKSPLCVGPHPEYWGFPHLFGPTHQHAGLTDAKKEPQTQTPGVILDRVRH